MVPLTTDSDVVRRILVEGPTFAPEGEALLTVGAAPSVVTVKLKDVKEVNVLPARLKSIFVVTAAAKSF